MNILTPVSQNRGGAFLLLESAQELSKLAQKTCDASEAFRKMGMARHCGLSAVSAYLRLTGAACPPEKIASFFDAKQVEERGSNFLQLKKALDALSHLQVSGSRSLESRKIEQILETEKAPLIAGIQRPGKSNHSITLIGFIPGESFIYHEPDGSSARISQEAFQQSCLGILYPNH